MVLHAASHSCRACSSFEADVEEEEQEYDGGEHGRKVLMYRFVRRMDIAWYPRASVGRSEVQRRSGVQRPCVNDAMRAAQQESETRERREDGF